VSQRLRGAYAPASQGPLGSAVSAFARFAQACPDRELFRQPRFHGDLQTAAYNEWTMILFVWYMVTTNSPSTGKPVKAGTIDTYVSLLKGYFSFVYVFDVLEKPIRLRRLIKDLTANEPLGGSRKKRPGLRRRHLVAALAEMLQRGPQAVTQNEINDAAAAGTAWHALARPGELAPSCKRSRWNREKHPTRADLRFGRSHGRNWAVVWLRPLKKRGKPIQPKVPQYIEEHDGSGSDVYLLLRMLEAIDPVPEEERASTPLFRRRTTSRGGKTACSHLTVAHMSTIMKSYAKAAGRADWALFGGHSARIGGATDLCDSGKASSVLLKAKGRWASDIGKIYSRLTRRALLASSRLMQKARARDLEEIFPEFVQPA
jgi:hypothetical protein